MITPRFRAAALPQVVGLRPTYGFAVWCGQTRVTAFYTLDEAQRHADDLNAFMDRYSLALTAAS